MFWISDGLDLRCGRKGNVKGNPKFKVLNNWGDKIDNACVDVVCVCVCVGEIGRASCRERV